MELKKIAANSSHYTALLYCKPGGGKSTMIGLIAEQSEGNTLVLDVDRTIQKTLAKGEVVKDTSKVIVTEIENRGKNEKLGIKGTFEAWTDALKELPQIIKDNNIKTIAVDNISELERCILSDLGQQGKNKGVPAMADYQYMQFKLVNSLRYMKGLGVNVVWTAWEDISEFTHPDGTKYSRIVPKVSAKVVDNICGLCDIVGWISVNKDGEHGVLLEATQNVYAKNQVDTRKGCKANEFITKTEQEKKEEVTKND